MPRFRPLHLTKAALRLLVRAIAAVLLLVVLAIVAVETGWVKEQIRRLIVRQANNYLTATLDIGTLQGSIFRGLTLGDVRLVQDGQTIISVDEVSLSYSIRELFEPGLIIRRIRLTRPHVVAAKRADGRWNLSVLLRRERRDQQQRSGPGRPLHILSIEVDDGDVQLKDPFTFGTVHIPTRYAHLNAALAFDYVPVTWTVQMQNVAWTGDADNITMERLTGTLSDAASGWEFRGLSARTTRSEFVVDGRVNRGNQPASLDLHAHAARFAFQEWSSLIGALHNIAVESAFDLSLKGPVHALDTHIDLKSAASGDIDASLVLDTAVPGWHGKGRASVARLDLSRWLNRDDRPSNITGDATFDIDLDLGRHFPRGAYEFHGPHAAYIGYEIDDLKARGTLTATDALIADATGTAYGSALHITNGSIGIDAPYTYRFQGSDTGLDLRRLPPEVPITHVDSQLALDAFDVDGQFETPAFIRGGAEFGASVYLGAAIGAGTVGSIDTSATPVRYTGEGDITGVDVGRFGADLDIGWMRDPRWAGVIGGRFHVDGAGSGETMRLDGGGRLARADLFGGELHDADVSIHIADGSLSGTYEGRLAKVDTERALADPSFAGTITGSARAAFSVRDLLLRTTTIDDYTVEGTLDAEESVVRGLSIYRGSVTGAMDGSTLHVTNLRTEGPIDMTGSGVIEFGGERSSDFRYQIGSGDLALAAKASGYDLHGTITTNGTLTGPMSAAHVTGEASLDDVEAGGTSVLSTTADYDITIPWDHPAGGTGRLTGNMTEIWTLDREIPSITGTVTYDNERVDASVKMQADPDPRSPLASVTLTAGGTLHEAARAFDLSALDVTIGSYPAWRLAGSAPAHVFWTDAGVGVNGFALADAATGTQHLSADGTWRNDGTGALQIRARSVSLDALTSTGGAPARYGGVLDADATVGGTRERPTVSANVSITDGRVRKLPYERLAGTVSYVGGESTVDLRLDQAAGVWLTAKGAFPISFDEKNDRPIELTIASSTIGLGLLEGITDVVSDVTGQVAVNVNVTGTAHQPRYSGTVSFTGAGFLVAASGVRYKNGRADLQLASDRITVSAFHLEDRNGRTLEVSGSLGTQARSVGDIRIQATSKRFEILHDATGTVDVGTNLTIRGDLNTPLVSGDVTILSGELKVDEIFERALFKPYATQAAATPAETSGAGAPVEEPIDAISALNPWDRLGLDIAIHSRGTLRMIGDNVQVATGTPLGLGSFNLRATGDIYVYKDPAQPMYITGSFDSISGSYAFQGRRFEVDPASSVVFRGDTNPEVYVSVNRLIQGIETRVTITGSLSQPSLLLTSNPPLEQSDILSLIVFNQTTADLSATQQQELAIRAGTLAYGFVATPLVSALQRSIGLETLEITPPTGAYGTTVTIGNELAPGLVAQFTREFGQEAYDEATVEYAISRILHIRATFSDAQTLVARSPFRRQERAGIDLLFFFSF